VTQGRCGRAAPLTAAAARRRQAPAVRAASGLCDMKRFAEKVIDHPWTERIVLALIMLNAITLGLETSEAAMAAVGELLLAVDRAVLAVFVAEIVLRMIARGKRFFADPWSIFDLAVVGASLLPFAQSLSIVRSLRVLRVLRLITIVPSLRRVVGALIGALPGMGSIVLLLGLLLYVFGVMATELFGEALPEQFGTLGIAVYTLFQLMTLDGWSGEIVRPAMDVFPYSWVFFLTFIVATAFTLFNLIIGVVVSAMQSEHEKEQAERVRAELETLEQEQLAAGRQPASLEGVLAELQALRADLAVLRAESGPRLG
jgi:voltage-gated sodium channel